MTGKERLENLINGKSVDYVPFFPKISHATYKTVSGMTMIDYMENPEAMAEALITSAKKYGYDGIGIMTDIGNEGMALGSIYERSVDSISKLTQYRLKQLEEYKDIVVKDFDETEPTRTVLKALKIIKEKVGEEFYVTAWCNGPLNVASQLIHLDEIMYAIIDEPDLLHQFLRFCTDYTVEYARKLVHAGADAVSFGHATASCTVISPSNYKEFALPYEKDIVNAIHAEGGKAITHICGNIIPIIKEIEQNGSDIIDCDHVCDLSQILNCTKAIIRGNMDPTYLATASPREIYQRTKEIIETGKDSGHFILGLGCEYSLLTPFENLSAMKDARFDFGKY